jgi:hypothetical protein
MKKFVSIVLTTGLLMGTVAFGALACDRRVTALTRFKTKRKWNSMNGINRPWSAAGLWTKWF